MRAMRTKVARWRIGRFERQHFAAPAQTNKQNAKKIGMQTRITHWPRGVEFAPHSGLHGRKEII